MKNIVSFNNANKFVLFFFILCFLSSCFSRKEIYLNDMLSEQVYKIPEIPHIILQKGDRVGIWVSSQPPELAIPFNNTFENNYKVESTGEVVSSERSQTSGYLIDRRGNIDFPVFGSLHVEGKTLKELKNMIQQALIDGKYINKPNVKVELLNFKISFLGSISNKVVNIESDKITILEAISMAGGLQPNGDPKKVTVFREENGVRKKIMVNILSKDIFSSPVFYLRQNDILYVEPKVGESIKEDRIMRNYSFVTGLISMTLAMIALITK